MSKFSWVTSKCWVRKSNDKFTSQKGKEISIRRSKYNPKKFLVSVATKDKEGFFVRVATIQSNKTRNMEKPAIIEHSRDKAEELAEKYMKKHDKC